MGKFSFEEVNELYVDVLLRKLEILVREMQQQQ